MHYSKNSNFGWGFYVIKSLKILKAFVGRLLIFYFWFRLKLVWSLSLLPPTYSSDDIVNSSLTAGLVKKISSYLFDHCGRRRAFSKPNFLRSTDRGSRIRKPSGLRIERRVNFSLTSARAIPSRIASA